MTEEINQHPKNPWAWPSESGGFHAGGHPGKHWHEGWEVGYEEGYEAALADLIESKKAKEEARNA